MILGDPSIWVDHLRRRNAASLALLDGADVAADPFVVGELACGSLRRQRDVIAQRSALPRVTTATHDEVRHFISAQRLGGHGIGSVDGTRWPLPPSITSACGRATRRWPRRPRVAGSRSMRASLEGAIHRGVGPSKGSIKGSESMMHRSIKGSGALMHQSIKGSGFLMHQSIKGSIHQGVRVLDASIHQGVRVLGRIYRVADQGL